MDMATRRTLLKKTLLIALVLHTAFAFVFYFGMLYTFGASYLSAPFVTLGPLAVELPILGGIVSRLEASASPLHGGQAA